MPVALVTGSAQGLGATIARRLAKDGYSLALNDLPSRQTELDELAAEFSSAVVVTGDVSDEADVKAMVARTVEVLGSLDVLVANAGVAIARPVLETTTEQWDRMSRINGRGTFLCYKYAAEQMIKQGRGGRIVGASSVAGKQGVPSISAYGATKFMVRGLTQSAALEWAKHGITVNAYAPGPVESDMMDHLAKDMGYKDLEAYKADTATGTPLGRMASTEDVANIVAYLVSDQASFITGQSISVNGGTYFD